MYKRLLPQLMFLLALAVSQPARAESDPEVHQRRLREELKLTEQQSAEVRKIFEKKRGKLEALRRQKHEIVEQARDRLRALLTPEQLQKFDRLREERRQQRGHRRAH
ncbi:hypothetical protein [Methylococcus sp. EFPC2]|uniref:hypothetical protein n=1 Tax=Methylococcus sp. EFPC2 TaxID=2812648 RepID=UPI001967134F|nr:hypothetical protein [Methylococcus sp. EFPC2]QSA98472.1 hypothetical protein JWZ97_06605 [Methylococcus sp. EFPC2]